MGVTFEDAIESIKELKAYNKNGELTTPVNEGVSMWWDGVFGKVLDLSKEMQALKAENAELRCELQPKKESKIVTFDEQMALYKEYEAFLKTLPPENTYSGEELWRLFTEQREEQEVER